MKTKFFFGRILFAGIIFLSLSCSTPQPVMRLHPVSTEREWLFGKEFCVHTSDGITVRGGFEKENNDDIFYDVEIINGSEETLQVFPQNFYCVYYDRTFDKLTPDDSSEKIFAYDPEQILLTLETQLSREQSDYDNARTGQLVGTIVSIAADIIFDKKYSKEDEERRDRASSQQSREMDERKSRIESLNAQREFWKMTALRNTTLRPNQSVRGIIAFPGRMYAKTVQIFFPLGKKENMLTFDQEVIYP